MRNMSNNRMGVGVIGIGLRGQHSYEQILRQDPRVKVRAVSVYPEISTTLLEGKDEKFFQQYADDIEAEYYSEDFQSVLARDDIGLISLMCEPSRALELGLICLSAGKHVLRDKPVAKTSAEAFALQLAANKAGRQLLFAMPLRYHRPLAQARQNIRAGAIGEIIAMNMSYVWASGPLDGFTASQKYLDCYGGGDVTTAGCHAIDYLNWLTGSRPLRVYCEQDSFFYADYQTLNMDDFGQLVIEYENDAVVTLVTGRVPSRKGCNNWLDVTGTAGTLEVHDFMPSLRVEGEDISRIGFDHDPLKELTCDMLDSLFANVEYSCNACDGGMALAVLEAARRSSESNRVEDVMIETLKEELLPCRR